LHTEDGDAVKIYPPNKYSLLKLLFFTLLQEQDRVADGKLPPGAATWLTGRNIDFDPFVSLCRDVIYKTEVHNLMRCCQRRTEPRPEVICTENSVK